MAGIAAALVLAVGCATSKPSEVDRFEASFARLEDLRVDTLWDDIDCVYFAYGRGVFSEDPDSLKCDVIGRGAPVPFDEQALLDFDEVRDALSVEYASISYDSDGRVSANTHFASDRCTTFIFRPGYEGPGELDSGARYTPINRDWFVIDYCG